MDILLVGTYTQHDAPAVLEKQELGKGIYLIPYNETLGGVAGTPFIIQMQNPSWVCLVKNRLFAVSESENAAEIVEYEVGVQEERLTAEKKAGLQMPGKASCHIEKDEKGILFQEKFNGENQTATTTEETEKILQGWLKDAGYSDSQIEEISKKGKKVKKFSNRVKENLRIVNDEIKTKSIPTLIL